MMTNGQSITMRVCRISSLSGSCSRFRTSNNNATPKYLLIEGINFMERSVSSLSPAAALHDLNNDITTSIRRQRQSSLPPSRRHYHSQSLLLLPMKSHYRYSFPINYVNDSSLSPSFSCNLTLQRWYHDTSSNNNQEKEEQVDEKKHHNSNNDDIVTNIANEIRADIRSYTKHNPDVKLIGIVAQTSTTSTNKNDDDLHDEKDNVDSQKDAELYSNIIARACAQDGIHYEMWKVSNEPSAIESVIQEANEREDVHGVLVYYPIFKKRTMMMMMQKEEEESRDGSMLSSSSSSSSRGPYKNRMTGVYYKTHDDYLRDLVSYKCDVEGLCHEYNARWMFRNADAYVYRSTNNFHTAVTADSDVVEAETTSQQQMGEVIFPCTALAVVKILESIQKGKEGYNPDAPIGERFEGTTVTIVNRSEVLGRPLAAMLANDGAMVYSVDTDSILLFRPGGRMRRLTTDWQRQRKSNSGGGSSSSATINLEWCIKQSSVLVTGVPSRKFCIPTDWIQPFTTIVNVASDPNVNVKELVGDDDNNAVVPGVTYIPQVGKVTTAVLEHNLIFLHSRYASSDAISPFEEGRMKRRRRRRKGRSFIA
mmetsp:Transcript_5895/g.8770  ORF Transcript_5895/g.8770 Transcript_5895/m.8770 type:complete len:593 (+) Transcript_5895:29-1807(+)